jgi:hypothetical protein
MFLPSIACHSFSPCFERKKNKKNILRFLDFIILTYTGYFRTMVTSHSYEGERKGEERREEKRREETRRDEERR